jgi:dTDP-4-dehydrorhamnose 3,5-epimerase
VAEDVTPQIDGVTIVPLREIADARGAVLHFMRADAPDFTRFGEAYFSEVAPGVVKGWKRHTRQTQNLTVPAGRIRLVLYDGRADSPTSGQIQTLELGRPDAYRRVRVPPGIWYAFGNIGAQPALLANCADLPHDPGESESKPLNDASIAYAWPQGGV